MHGSWRCCRHQLTWTQTKLAQQLPGRARWIIAWPVASEVAEKHSGHWWEQWLGPLGQTRTVHNLWLHVVCPRLCMVSTGAQNGPAEVQAALSWWKTPCVPRCCLISLVTGRLAWMIALTVSMLPSPRCGCRACEVRMPSLHTAFSRTAWQLYLRAASSSRRNTCWVKRLAVEKSEAELSLHQHSQFGHMSNQSGRACYDSSRKLNLLFSEG